MTMIATNKGTNHVARYKWGSSVEFTLSCLGSAVGLGNLWRFPYLCGRNGGAAFLIAYVIMLILLGLPTFYMEMLIGQYSGTTPLFIYGRMSPVFAGLGYATLFITIYISIYYAMILAWSLHYMLVSLTGIIWELPWSSCTNSWNTPDCYDEHVTFESNTSFASNQSALWNVTNVRTTSAEEYNAIKMLAQGSGINDYGLPKWDLSLALALVWLLIFAALFRGIKSSAKIVYFTATFPFLLLVVLIIRGLMLDGAGDGVLFFMTLNMSYLLHSGTWVEASHQVLFSLSLGNGGMITLASYNHFHNNIFRDTLLVVLGECISSILSGFAIFPIIGYIVKTLSPTVPALTRVKNFAENGPTLAFITYPNALIRLPAPWFWSSLFFFMLLILGLDSEMVMVEVLMSSIEDWFPKVRRPKNKVLIFGCICSSLFLIGLSLATPFGPYLINLADKYAGGMNMISTSFIEMCMISFVYGNTRFVNDIRAMLGEPTSRLWKALGYPVNRLWTICWTIITPFMLLLNLVVAIAIFERTDQGSGLLFPTWSEVLGGLMMASCLLWIPGVALYSVVRAYRELDDDDEHHNNHTRLKGLFRPTIAWVPNNIVPSPYNAI